MVIEQLLRIKATAGHFISYDLDCTLVDTRPYFFAQAQQEVPLPRDTAELMAIYHYIQDVPEWKNNPKIKKLTHYLQHDNDKQMSLPVMNGAIETVKNVSLPPIYTTGRPECVRSGTKVCLSTHGFEEGPLIMRPEQVPVNKWRKWKAHVLNFLYPTVPGHIDDDLEMAATLYQENYPGDIFLFGHSRLGVSTDEIILCQDMSEVEQKVNECYASL